MILAKLSKTAWVRRAFETMDRVRARALGVGALLLAAACSSSPDVAGPAVYEPPTPSDQRAAETEPAPRDQFKPNQREFVDPLHMQGEKPVRVGLLLPFSAPSKPVQKIASAMFNAAQLAAFEAGNDQFLLIPKDTKGTPEGATAAARAALGEGAEILLGPLYAASVEAVADVAAPLGRPVIAFSSDLKSTRDGVYLLSFPPEAEVERITEYAMENGLLRFGLMAPSNEYGRRVSDSFSSQLAQRGGFLVHEERYEQDVEAMRAPAKRLAEYSRDIIPVELRHTYDPNRPSTGSDDGYARGYQAVLIPERGTLLRALAPLFPYYNVDIKEVKLLGISAWNNPRLAREPALQGGWFAAPDPEITEAFAARYEEAFDARPPRLASLSYDATLLTARLAQNPRARDRFSKEAITNPNGYLGADGLFRLREDGSVERGLAILEINPSGAKVIEPAPRRFGLGF